MFNNAGITGALGPITEIETDHWDQSFAVMARGAVSYTHLDVYKRQGLNRVKPRTFPWRQMSGQH